MDTISMNTEFEDIFFFCIGHSTSRKTSEIDFEIDVFMCTGNNHVYREGARWCSTSGPHETRERYKWPR
jgi:hypothetical protein